jgi:hypothetical protein
VQKLASHQTLQPATNLHVGCGAAYACIVELHLCCCCCCIRLGWSDDLIMHDAALVTATVRTRDSHSLCGAASLVLCAESVAVAKYRLGGNSLQATSLRCKARAFSALVTCMCYTWQAYVVRRECFVVICD